MTILRYVRSLLEKDTSSWASGDILPITDAEQSERIEVLEQQQAEVMMPPGTRPPIAPPLVQQDRTAQLQQLAELKEKGVLTDAESKRRSSEY
jgi:hypothetical protein